MFSKVKTVIKDPSVVIWKIQELIDRKQLTRTRLKTYKLFEKEGVLSFLKAGDKQEFDCQYIKLANLYKLIQLRKPKIVLEFGVGFSTLAIAAALKNNYSKYKNSGHLYTVDAEERWIDNTKKKIPFELKDYVTFHYSPVKIEVVNNQLCSLYESLPNICPNFILLDGPSPKSVAENVRGLSFNEGRPIVAADILLYESSAPLDFFIYVDGRWRNCNFLRNSLKGKYKHKKKIAQKYQTFEFIE
tara:strand:- start:71 stop:802 length:732 start_codon:yes stop_codon:yes gene_type:complete